MSALVILFMLFDGVTKLLAVPQVKEAQAQLGYPEAIGPVLGAVSLICLVLYVIPRTSVLGAILLTGYLGGAISAQVRIGAPTFNIVFPVIFGLLTWGGLFLRERRLQTLLPFKR